MTIEETEHKTLGQILREALSGTGNGFSGELNRLIDSQQTKNPWFTPANVRMAVSAIASELTTENLRKWTGMYPGLRNDCHPMKIAVGKGELFARKGIDFRGRCPPQMFGTVDQHPVSLPDGCKTVRETGRIHCRRYIGRKACPLSLRNKADPFVHKQTHR